MSEDILQVQILKNADWLSAQLAGKVVRRTQIVDSFKLLEEEVNIFGIRKDILSHVHLQLPLYDYVSEYPTQQLGQTPLVETGRK